MIFLNIEIIFLLTLVKDVFKLVDLYGSIVDILRDQSTWVLSKRGFDIEIGFTLELLLRGLTN